jgi:hypothetical protein
VSFDIKDRYKIDALLREYTEIRSEVRTFETLQVICIFISILSFATIFSTGIIFDEYILVLISPAFSIFFILIAMGILMYDTNLALRSVQIEGKLRNYLGDPTIEWEQTVGIFGLTKGGILSAKVGKYWIKFSSLAIAVGIFPVLFGLYYGFDKFFKEIGIVAWYVVIFYIIISGLTIFVGYRFYTRDWEKVKLSL